MDLLPEFRVWARGAALMMMNLADQFHAFLGGRGSPWGNRLASAKTLTASGYGFSALLIPSAGYQDKVWIYRFYERRADVSKALDPANAQQWPAEMRLAIDPTY